tara:strand:- start:101743 stop:102138 length:396 start_codon:yes stop_codon:yes gene_type:complete
MMNAINSLIRESHEHYVGLIRLLLTLSAAYIAIATAITGSVDGEYDALQKTAIAMHSISILLGLWLHVFLVAVPLRNVKEYIEHVEEQKRKGATNPFWPQPSRLQRFVFYFQVITFAVAFILVTFNALFVA